MKTRSILIIENNLRSTISRNERTISELERKIVILRQESEQKKKQLTELEKVLATLHEVAQQVAGTFFNDIEIPEFLAKELPFQEPVLKNEPEGFIPSVLISKQKPQQKVIKVSQKFHQTHFVSQRKKSNKEFCVNCSICICGDFEYQRSVTDPTRCSSCSDKYLRTR